MVTLHEPGEVPQINEKGIAIPPGSSARINMEATVIKRQPKPYPSQCIDQWDQTNISYADEIAAGTGFSHSHQTFDLTLLQMHIKPQLDMTAIHTIHIRP